MFDYPFSSAKEVFDFVICSMNILIKIEFYSIIDSVSFNIPLYYYYSVFKAAEVSFKHGEMVKYGNKEIKVGILNFGNYEYMKMFENLYRFVDAWSGIDFRRRDILTGRLPSGAWYLDE